MADRTSWQRGRPAAVGVLTGVLVVLPTLALPSGHPAAPARAAEECSQDTPLLIAEPPSAHARLGAQEAWRHATGRGVVVAVVDSGVDVGNAHLGSGAVLPGIDLVGAEGDPRGWSDPAGHGTAIAGQIAARPVDGSGLLGLAPDAQVLPVRVYHSDDASAEQAGTGPTTARIAEGIRWAVENGARVVNVSLSSAVDDPRLAEAVRVAGERGALVVASAGNLDPDSPSEGPRYPAAYDGVLAVAAVDAQDTVAGSVQGEHVDLAAPGSDVLTTFHAAGDCVLGGQSAFTSYATAYVSAAAALLAERYPDETPAQWAHRLTATAARTTTDRRDDRVGWGVVRPAAALAFVDDGSAPGPASPVHESPGKQPDVPEPLGLGASPDVLADAQEISAWWALAGVVVVVGALVLSRLRPTRRPDVRRAA